MQTTQETARLLTVAEAASQLGVSRHTIYRWIRDEGLPAVELRGLNRIPSRALDDWLGDQEQRARARAAP
jgi:excisionase family DNA binding protein